MSLFVQDVGNGCIERVFCALICEERRDLFSFGSACLACLPSSRTLLDMFWVCEAYPDFKFPLIYVNLASLLVCRHIMPRIERFHRYGGACVAVFDGTSAQQDIAGRGLGL